ncbi:DUF2569 domain-containing protein [Proteus penneri]|uniref:DUF2569 domain-containing protein n=1 Tax=Proteus penneri TaxID=102862 RepID=A0ABS0VZA6_9GAMM|nr:MULTISPECIES: DUF2569 domain-containing protein [Proteus]MBJ2116395.1 DUF2569 domain-containing protein [Proteus penneri]MCO8050565.1 DUF2569 domain-containing protein [Proteus penneri]NBL89015.1 DUF2569 family protein [Proteus sp. G2673]NBM98173.1 DUF2569 family protein [Proteus sp. G2660]QPT34076.1 DUF2569 domain-containing protein [Proteus penneri]
MKFDLKANTQNNLSGKAPITGWLLAPLAYMILSVIGSGLMSVLYIIKYFSDFSILHQLPFHLISSWYLSALTTWVMFSFTLYLLRQFFYRAKNFPRLFVFWLLINLLLAIKSFGFAPVDDQTALQSLLWSVFSTVCFVPYIKYSKRVRETFTQVR